MSRVGVAEVCFRRVCGNININSSTTYHHQLQDPELEFPSSGERQM